MSRNRLLPWLVIGMLLGVVVIAGRASAAGSEIAAAAAGDPLILGSASNASAATTTLNVTTAGDGLTINNTNTGVALRGTSASGHAIVGQASGTGPFAGVLGIGAGPGNIAVSGQTQAGLAAVYGTNGGGAGVVGVSGNPQTAGVVASSSATNGLGLLVQGRLQVQGNAIGQATLAAGTTSVTVTTPAATAQSIILFTPLSDPADAGLWVDARAAGSFTIKSNRTLSDPIDFQYLIVN
jgi:hypothetical protein